MGNISKIVNFTFWSFNNSLTWWTFVKICLLITKYFAIKLYIESDHANSLEKLIKFLIQLGKSIKSGYLTILELILM